MFFAEESLCFRRWNQRTREGYFASARVLGAGVRNDTGWGLKKYERALKNPPIEIQN